MIIIIIIRRRQYVVVISGTVRLSLRCCLRRIETGLFIIPMPSSLYNHFCIPPPHLIILDDCSGLDLLLLFKRKTLPPQ